MKKIILSTFAISIFILTTFSCSNYEIENSNSLIGNWYKVGNIGSTPLNDCEKQSYRKFSNTIMSSREYRIDDEGNCSIYFEGEYPYVISEGALMVDGIEIAQQKLITEGNEIYFVVNENNLSLFFIVGGKYIVKESYVKER